MVWRVLRAVFAPLFANEPLPSNAPETALFTMPAKGGLAALLGLLLRVAVGR
jgi:hypothetical protein